jgi:hypothetical protein
MKYRLLLEDIQAIPDTKIKELQDLHKGQGTVFKNTNNEITCRFNNIVDIIKASQWQAVDFFKEYEVLKNLLIDDDSSKKIYVIPTKSEHTIFNLGFSATVTKRKQLEHPSEQLPWNIL